MKFLAILGSITLAAAVGGCTSAPPRSATTQPSGATAVATDFDRLMNATDDVSRDLLFKPAVQDYRSGLYRTEPMISAQWFEIWRADVRTSSDAAESSLSKVRRTLTVRIEKDEAGKFIAKPDVLVERYSLAERRLTTAAGYRSIFRERYRSTGNSLTDAGVLAPDAYWYSVGNDPELERYVARKIEERLNS
jgi:hypothetical protein